MEEIPKNLAESERNDEYDEYKEKYENLLKEIKEEFPNFSLIQKGTSKFSRMLGKLSFWNNEFNSVYITTIGPKIYVNSGLPGKRNSWNNMSYKKRFDVLLHERIHQRQTQKYGLLSFFLVFGLVPLPAKLAYYRMKWEMEAYEIGIYINLKEKGREYVLGEKFINNMLDQFCGPFYFYMWFSKKHIIKWILKTVRAIEKGNLTWKMLVNRRKRIKKSKSKNKRKTNNHPLRIPRILCWLYPDEFSH